MLGLLSRRLYELLRTHPSLFYTIMKLYIYALWYNLKKNPTGHVSFPIFTYSFSQLDYWFVSIYFTSSSFPTITELTVWNRINVTLLWFLTKLDAQSGLTRTRCKFQSLALRWLLEMLLLHDYYYYYYLLVSIVHSSRCDNKELQGQREFS